MSFNSLQFIVFFILVFFVHYSLPHRFRWAFLLGVSYYFYMCWKAEYVVLIVVSTLVNYFAGILMSQESTRWGKQKYLILSCGVSLGLLFFFKYFNFFSGSLNTFFNHWNIFCAVPAFNVLLPVGISFYTFQTLSYSIDVYRGVKEPERHLGIFALYVVFFPQLVAGPIERSTRLIPQLHQAHDFDYRRVVDGLKLAAWGMFKKVVIADRLALLVTQVYDHPQGYNGVFLLMATYFFAFQIYCDFSGYTDIAIGTAKVLGYDLMENFNRPYFAQSIPEFWRRWHISLTTWFRDYVYIPLGGNRVSKIRWYANLLIVFVLSGLWHGANWTFIVWGALHGIYYCFFVWTGRLRQQWVKACGLERYPFVKIGISIFVTFHLVIFSWIFFRANSIGDAFYISTHLLNFDGTWTFLQSLQVKGAAEKFLGLSKLEIFVSIFLILFLLGVHFIQRFIKLIDFVTAQHWWVRWAVYYLGIVSTVFLGRYEVEQFIYFQF